MKIEVEMLAFGTKDGEEIVVRTVEIPDDQWNDETNNRLGLVFYYGQNDFQPQKLPSVSMGDVIRLEDMKIVVQGIGFRSLTPNEYQQYVELNRLDRQFSHFVNENNLILGFT